MTSTSCRLELSSFDLRCLMFHLEMRKALYVVQRTVIATNGIADLLQSGICKSARLPQRGR